MSKLKAQGNASGTGVFTLETPATNTDRTITLPDETGTLVSNTATGVDVTGRADVIDTSGNNTAQLRLTDSTDTTSTYLGQFSNGTRLTNNATYASGWSADDSLVGVTSLGLIDDYIVLGTAAAGASSATERMRIDASGNVGIGTSSPQRALHVDAGTVDVTALFESDAYTHVSMWDGVGGAKISNLSGAFGIYTGSNSDGSGGAERMRIDSVGKVNVNRTTSGGGSLNVKSHSSSNFAMEFYHHSNDASVGAIITTTSSTSYNTSSDYRLKENVVPMSASIDRLKQLKPCKFNFIADATTTVDGFLAHEAQAVVPEAVSGDKDAMTTEEYEVTPAVEDDEGNVVTEAVMGTREVEDYQGIDQSKLVPLLTSALQEAVAKIEALEQRVTTLEGGTV